MKFSVPEMSCAHCTAAIEKAVHEVESSARVICDLESQTVEIHSSQTVESLKSVLAEAGYAAKAI